MSVVNQSTVLQEVVVSLRNANIMSTTVRDVNRTTQTGNLTNDDEIVIDKSNVKNVVSVVVGGATVTGYSVDYYTDDECTISLVTSLTGAYTVTYDYGNDKIFAGYPRDDLSISSFPRVAVEYVDIVSVPGGFGNVNRNKHDLSIVAYGAKKEDVRTIINNVRSWVINNQNELSTLKLIKPVLMTGLMPAGEFSKFKDKVYKQSLDIAGLLQYEVNN